MKTNNLLKIVYEDDQIVAVNKPSGLLTIPDRKQSEKSLKEMLKDIYGEIFTIHRIDRDTSGLVIFAKTDVAHKYMCKLFEARQLRKFYMGIVLGNPSKANGDIEAPIGENPAKPGVMNVHRNGKPAHTAYEVLEAHGKYSLVKFQLHTGRTHQIRVHCKEIGHPLACDPIYGDGKAIFGSALKKNYNLGKRVEEEIPILDRLALHASSLGFETQAGSQIELAADIPKSFRAIMQQLKKHG